VELQACEPNLCAWEDHRIHPAGRHMGHKEMIPDSQHSRLCLTNLVAFYDVVTASVEKRRATDITYLNSARSFFIDVFSHHILISILERYGFEG